MFQLTGPNLPKQIKHILEVSSVEIIRFKAISGEWNGENFPGLYHFKM